MATIERYVLVTVRDEELDPEFETLDEARAANPGDCAIIARQYEYTGDELIETPNGRAYWPPASPFATREVSR